MVDGMRCISLGSYQVSLGDFTSVEEGYAWVHNAQLQRLVLFFLLHGEAANLRHLPECLCFIFYNLVLACIAGHPRVAQCDGRRLP